MSVVVVMEVPFKELKDEGQHILAFQRFSKQADVILETFTFFIPLQFVRYFSNMDL